MASNVLAASSFPSSRRARNDRLTAGMTRLPARRLVANQFRSPSTIECQLDSHSTELGTLACNSKMAASPIPRGCRSSPTPDRRLVARATCPVRLQATRRLLKLASSISTESLWAASAAAKAPDAHMSERGFLARP
eukprot:CAMPEP_0198330638 /NCGR_PEP_ID=MMETSP1450-20131203/17061_1 /TAXON_ID=753684 ORGANISM="Madagascaria erythrocladiodes, Strain CCMP3234" /NCGR_SAMPLE_ID=MMETSP1450 /ASSEMBLY_ACC=CAM_ASM_001115 /LENGTH=135 /DNA_ID=CAMNT_0044034959 /DNA_START=170 /DNA_END=577 /DNA_ORIENTATION=+